MIKREIVDEIIMRNDIESLIGSYVSLKRAGSNLKGLCPFHSEKSPSFTVYPSSNSFYCFGCGVGGNAITFVEKIEHMDYQGAVEFLGKRAGITVIREGKNPAREAKSFDKGKMLRMNTDAAKFFHNALFENTEEANNALSYLTQKRGLALSVIKHFGLGFAPNSYDSLSKYMLARGYSYDELTAGFLCGKNDRETYYDAFRNRIMFPIIDVSGNVIAFGGRVMDDSKPKYKNSSDTPVYKKLRHLFALNFARHTCAETMILCEGYMDVIAMHAAGFTNAVATLGTALTAEQARVMSRYTKKVVICYDSDEPGQKAAQRAVKILSDVGLDIAILKIPGSKDPDEYIKNFGAEKFSSVINQSKTPFEYSLENILSAYDINIPKDKVKATMAIVKLISEVSSSSEREIYLQISSKSIDMPKETLKIDVEKQIKKNFNERTRDEKQKNYQRTLGYQDKINPDYAKAPTVAKNEENVLGLLLLYPNHRKTVFEQGILTEDDFYTEFNKRVFAFIRDTSDADYSSIGDFNEFFNADEAGRLVKMKIIRMELSENGDSVLEESIKSLKKSIEKKKTETTNTYEGLEALLKMKRADREI